MDTSPSTMAVPTAAIACYRAALRAGTAQRTGARKQEALQVASDRYRIPMGQLKRSIRAEDERLGVTHKHTAPYLRRLAFQQAGEELEKTNNGVCPSCGGANDAELPTGSANEVRVRANPFAADVHDELVPLLSCFICYLRLAEDI